MLVFTDILSAAPPRPGLGEVTLDHEQRCRGRLQTQLPDGRTVGLALPRGALLRDGTILATNGGEWCVVKAQAEPISTARSSDTFLMMRAAFHLGNRHVLLQLEPGCIRYLTDTGIDSLCASLGLSVQNGLGAFEPEKLGTHGHNHDRAAVSVAAPPPSSLTR